MLKGNKYIQNVKRIVSLLLTAAILTNTLYGCGFDKGSVNDAGVVIPEKKYNAVIEHNEKLSEQTIMVSSVFGDLKSSIKYGQLDKENQQLIEKTDELRNCLDELEDETDKWIKAQEKASKSFSKETRRLFKERTKKYKETVEENRKKAEDILSGLEDSIKENTIEETEGYLNELEEMICPDDINTYGEDIINNADDTVESGSTISVNNKVIDRVEPSDEAGIVMSDELKAKTHELSTPLNVYNFLRNNINTEFYFGERKGVNGTYDAMAGNDYDQAGLLIAMLRYLGYEAEYVRGTARFTAEQAIGLTGASDIKTAADVMAACGTPVSLVTVGEEAKYVDAEHVWVRVNIPYTDYRGALPAEGDKVWLDLDTSVKMYEAVDSIYELMDSKGITDEMSAFVDYGIDTQALYGTDVDSFLDGIAEKIKEDDLTDVYAVNRKIHGSFGEIINDEDAARRFMFTAGIISSQYESTVWEEITGEESISTISILEQAIEDDVDIITITSANLDASLDILRANDEGKLSTGTIDDIRKAVSAGRIAVIPVKHTQIGSWSGYGYILLDPQTGVGAYMISGGLNGGMSPELVGLAAMVDLGIAVYDLVEMVFTLVQILPLFIAAGPLGAAVGIVASVFLINMVVKALYETYSLVKAALNGDTNAAYGIFGNIATNIAVCIGTKAAGYVLKRVAHKVIINAAVKKCGVEAVERLVGQYGDDAAKYISKYGDDFVKICDQCGEEGYELVRKHGNKFIYLYFEYGDGVVKGALKYGDDFVSYLFSYGDDFIKALESNGNDVIEELRIGEYFDEVAYWETTKRAANSKVLKNNLISSGVIEPNYRYATHHIVAGKSPKADEARKILEKFQIDINDACNGVFLPIEKNPGFPAVYHPSLHTNEYYRTVNKLLSRATSKEDVFDILYIIRDELLDGTFSERYFK